MSYMYDEAGLAVVLAGATHSTAEVALLLESMQMLVSASIWASLTCPEIEDQTLTSARNVLLRALESEHARSRFYPKFSEALREPGVLPFESSPQSEERPFHTYDWPFDLTSALDMATAVGVNSWMQRELLRHNRELHQQVFGFAAVRRAEHNSPLLLELGIVLGAAVAVPVLLTYGLMRAAARAKRMNTEAEIREIELAEKKVALRQREVQLLIQEEVADALKEQRKRNPNYQVPETVLANVVQFASPAVSDLGSSPLIEKISFSASIGSKS